MRKIVLVTFPVIPISILKLGFVFIRTICDSGEVLLAAMLPLGEEIPLLVSHAAHPRWIILTKTATVDRKVGEEVSIARIGISIVCCVIFFRVHSCFCVWAVKIGRKPVC